MKKLTKLKHLEVGKTYAFDDKQARRYGWAHVENHKIEAIAEETDYGGELDLRYYCNDGKASDWRFFHKELFQDYKVFELDANATLGFQEDAV